MRTSDFFARARRDVEGAQSAAREALELARRLEFGLIEASALENLAFAEAAGGKLSQAIAHAEEALDIRARSQSQVWTSKTLADLAVWHAAQGNLAAARDCVRRLLAGEKAILTSTEWPEYCYWAAAQVFRLDGNMPEALRLLERARQTMQATADGLDAADRESFAAVPWHADIAAAAGAKFGPSRRANKAVWGRLRRWHLTPEAASMR